MRECWLCVVAVCVVVASPAEAAGNRFTNPDFDHGMSPWQARVAGYATASDQEDFEDFRCQSAAGSAQLVQIAPEGSWYINSIEQCLPATSGESLHPHGRVLLTSGVDVLAAWYLNTYSTADCSGQTFGSESTGTVPLVVGTWVNVPEDEWTTAPTQVGTQSARISILIMQLTSANPVGFTAYVDHAYLGVPGHIFEDGFEVDRSCHWSTQSF